MNKETILTYFIFNNDEEKEEAKLYLRVKGIYHYKKIMKHLGFNFEKEDQQIEWGKVSNTLKYDKKIRNRTYVYLATLEEYIRAYIVNKYSEDTKKTFWLSNKNSKNNIKKRVEENEILAEIFESIEFGTLIRQVNALPPTDLDEIFEIRNDLKECLNAVRVLRNAVSHHVFLLNYKFNSCNVEGIESGTLEHNLKNLRQLLPKEFRYGKNGKGGITGDIENCMYNFFYDENGKRVYEKMALDEKDIISIKNQENKWNWNKNIIITKIKGVVL